MTQKQQFRSKPVGAKASRPKAKPQPIVTEKASGINLMPRMGTSSVEPIRGMDTPAMHSHIYVLPEALAKMNTLIQHCAQEVGWYGTVEDYGDVLVIDEIYLFEQEVTSATTRMDKEKYTKFMHGFLTDPSQRPEGMTMEEAAETASRIRFWGHSHVNMGVSPSGTDDDTMEKEFVGGVKGSNMPYMIRGIGNKKGVLVFDIYYYDLGLAVMDVSWSILDQAFDSDPLVEEMTAKISQGHFQYGGGYYGGYGGGYYQNSGGAANGGYNSQYWANYGNLSERDYEKEAEDAAFEGTINALGHRVYNVNGYDFTDADLQDAGIDPESFNGDEAAMAEALMLFWFGYTPSNLLTFDSDPADEMGLDGFVKNDISGSNESATTESQS